jgi:hypothetical protein
MLKNEKHEGDGSIFPREETLKSSQMKSFSSTSGKVVRACGGAPELEFFSKT